MSHHAPSLTGWMEVLDHIERSLSSSLSLTREPAAGTAPPAGGNAATSLARLDDLLATWQTYLERVQVEADEAEDQSETVQETLAAWRTAQTAVRESLAGWVSRTRSPTNP